ncbi:hypothetical protein OQ496_09315 [Acetobacter suratthaniensis]|uniref:TtsA-like Glycoside hydrolase family 108 domain-containing protein n=1 Tax=Acetobacter suratthaniensis TaxID=1502841 RepID=A0ABS3LMD0_9PROT|nr:glycosyl hydrolase 108 family protein [Acetobacter suratthaniensis]MBO1328528.1 hypothetical protein [Acetobacter suratthaniensis]MCX2566657.1 hypothetical protein [Acetobacter suratthaniensis]
MDSNFEKIATETEGREGLYSATRSDPGNWTSGIVGVGRLAGTMRGISAPVMAHWLGSAELVTPQIMRGITHATFLTIARALYWRTLNCAALGPGLSRMLFDFGFNSGVSRAGRQLQHIVGLSDSLVDGDIGPRTLAAVVAVSAPTVAPLVSPAWGQKLQQDLGVSPDGALGPVTMAAVARQANAGAVTRVLIYALASAQEQAYRSFRGFDEYGHGWLARLDWRVSRALSDLDGAVSA